MPIENKLEAIEEALIAEAVRLSDGNKSGAARLLGHAPQGRQSKVVTTRSEELGARHRWIEGGRGSDWPKTAARPAKLAENGQIVRGDPAAIRGFLVARSLLYVRAV